MTLRELRNAALALAALVAIAPGAPAQTLAIVGGTVIDGTGRAPIPDAVVVVRGDRIVAVGTSRQVTIPESATVVDARGRYVIPGLMDANVHLFFPFTLEMLTRYEGRYHEIVLEAAQVALKSGLTTVFDTWGEHAALATARATINAGRAPGCRIFFAGTIIGLEGPLTPEFLGEPSQAMASPAYVARVNAAWQQGVGRELTWLGPEAVRPIVRDYAAGDEDFLKYASSGHRGGEESLICFSPRVQRVIVEEGHRAGKTVQAHVTSVESMELAIEAGVDIVTHGDITGPRVAIPDETIRRLVDRGLYVSVMPVTRRFLDALRTVGPAAAQDFAIGRANDEKLIQAGVRVMIGTDSTIFNPVLAPAFDEPRVDPRFKLGEGHFNALAALEERGMKPMEILKAATSTVARAYRLDADLGTLEVGKIADLVILDKDPLAGAANYRSIRAVIKAGAIVDRDALPAAPVISSLRPVE